MKELDRSFDVKWMYLTTIGNLGLLHLFTGISKQQGRALQRLAFRWSKTFGDPTDDSMKVQIGHFLAWDRLVVCGWPVQHLINVIRALLDQHDASMRWAARDIMKGRRWRRGRLSNPRIRPMEARTRQDRKAAIRVLRKAMVTDSRYQRLIVILQVMVDEWGRRTDLILNGSAANRSDRSDGNGGAPAGRDHRGAGLDAVHHPGTGRDS